MGYVKTAEEVRAAQELLRNLRYEGERLKVLFRTDPDFVRDVLPPCFSPASEPLGLATVTRSKSVGEDSLDTRFLAASLFVRATWGGIEGWHHLTMLLTGDMPVTIGRELFGEAKKRADIDLEVDGDQMRGSALRHGTCVIEIQAELGKDLGPRELNDTFLELKCFLDAQALDLEYDPIVGVSDYQAQIEVYREGTGSLTLRTSQEDPCGSVPVVAVESISYDQHRSRYGHTESQRLEHRDGYLPYVMGRSYDFSNVV